MGAMLKQLWTMLAALFAAGETAGKALNHGAKALEHLGTWAEESAGSFADEARESRKIRLQLLEAQNQKALENLGAQPLALPKIEG